MKKGVGYGWSWKQRGFAIVVAGERWATPPTLSQQGRRVSYPPGAARPVVSQGEFEAMIGAGFADLRIASAVR